MFLIGNIYLTFVQLSRYYYRTGTFMKYSPSSIGGIVRAARKALKVTQRDLALTSGTGLRFITDLEKGKPTCQLGKVLTVLNTLGITMILEMPEIQTDGA